MSIMGRKSLRGETNYYVIYMYGIDDGIPYQKSVLAVLVEQCSETTTDGQPTSCSAPEVPVDFSPATSTLTMPVGRSAEAGRLRAPRILSWSAA